MCTYVLLLISSNHCTATGTHSPSFPVGFCFVFFFSFCIKSLLAFSDYLIAYEGRLAAQADSSSFLG